MIRSCLGGLLLLAIAMLVGCAHSKAVPVQPITDWEAAQIGAQSMNQVESWEPNVVYETRQEGDYWRVLGYKTKGKDLHGAPIYEPGMVRVVKISKYGRVVDFWRKETGR